MNIQYNSSTISIKTRKINLHTQTDDFQEEKVAVEAPIQLILNGKDLTTIMTLPTDLKEFALGFLIDEGVIPSKVDIVDLKINDAKIWIKSKKINSARYQTIRQRGIVSTSCSSKTDFYQVIGELEKSPLVQNYFVDSEDIMRIVKVALKRPVLFQLTGGVHWAAISTDSQIKGFAEDVGRHNAVDKAIGICLLNDIPLQKSILITSGRQSAEIVIKAARCRIPIVVSMRAPLSSGVYAAELAGVTLICFARGYRMNIYTHSYRIHPLKK